MTRPRARSLLGVVAFACFSTAALEVPDSSGTVVRGWLSDEGSARGRASGGVYTGTNPECARQCVDQGKKIVLIDPAAKTILNIANQNAAKKNIGDYVGVTGVLKPQMKRLQIDSLRMLAAGKAMCALPQPAK